MLSPPAGAGLKQQNNPVAAYPQEKWLEKWTHLGHTHTKRVDNRKKLTFGDFGILGHCPSTQDITKHVFNLFNVDFSLEFFELVRHKDRPLTSPGPKVVC